MSYVALSDLSGLIPDKYLTDALDDNGDGTTAAWDAVAAAASAAVEGILSTRFATPFLDPAPPIVTEATKIFAAEMIYRRRSVANEQNPFFSQAETMREQLKQMALGKIPLSPVVNRKNPSGATIVEAAPTWSGNGLRMS